MNRDTLADAVAAHARLVIKAREGEALAARLAIRGDDMAEIEAVRAMEARRDADAIRELLRPFADVHVPEPGQLSLWGDGR